jgi:heme-degrading monooxygenase HmoA
MKPFTRREMLETFAAGLLLPSALNGALITAAGGSTMNQKAEATIARVWRGRVRRERAEEYQAYWLSQLGKLREQASGLDLFREDRETESEFISISYWPDETAMKQFSKNENPTAVHHLPRDHEFLIELPKSVQLLKVIKA